MTVFNLNKVDYKKQPMFFGESLNVGIDVSPKFPFIETLTKQMLSLYWTPEEVSLSQDRLDYKGLSDAQKHVFTSNLKYQILLDSVAGRSPNRAFLPILSNPEFEMAVVTWSMFEASIHDKSYTYMLRNLYANPEEILDDVVLTEEIVVRAKSIGEAWDKLIFLGQKYSLYKEHGYGQPVDEEELYEALYKCFISVYILESLRFYVSFACTFAFAEIGVMKGSAKLMQLIARDENKHFGLSLQIINLMHTNPEQIVPNPSLLTKVIQQNKHKVVEVFKQAVQEEKNWANYLFKDGSMLGLSAELLHQYVEWLSNRRITSIGFDKLFPEVSTLEANNPLPWTKNWLSSKSKQVAPQQEEITSYLIGSINKNVEIPDGGFEL